MTTQELIEKIQRHPGEIDAIYINHKTFRTLFAEEMERAPRDRFLTPEFGDHNKTGIVGRFVGIPFIIADEMPDNEVTFRPFFATTIDGTWGANTVAVNHADFNDWRTATATTANYTTITVGQYGNMTTDFTIRDYNNYATDTTAGIYQHIKERLDNWPVQKPTKKQLEELPEISDKDFDEILGMGVA